MTWGPKWVVVGGLAGAPAPEVRVERESIGQAVRSAEALLREHDDWAVMIGKQP